MMDGNKRNFFKKRPNIQFKRKGGNNNYKKGKWNESGHEQPLEDYQSLETVYRILCPSKKIGGVIGKGGNIVKALREETRAKISVSDSVLGSDERVIIIYSSPTKISSKQNNNEDSDEGNEMEPHCAAQNALLKVHARIVEEDLFGGVTFDDDNENSVVTTRLLVPNNTVGCVLGKRGDVIQRLRSETGASIRVLPADQLPTCAMETDELVQDLWNPRSQTIEAILELQNITSEFSDKGIIITKLLVPSSKVGCLLGQGGQVINEMRRRTQADIRVYSKDDRPACAAEDEELVQISGNLGTAKDALAEITSRLRVRTLRDTNAGAEPAPVGLMHRFGPAGCLPGGGPLPTPSAVGAGSSGGYDPLKVSRHEYQPQSHRIPPIASGYPRVNYAMEGKIPTNAVDFPGTVGRSFSTIREVGVSRAQLQDSQGGGFERSVEIGGSDHLNAAQNILRPFLASADQNVGSQSGSYRNVNAPQGSYHKMIPQQSPYQINSQQSPYQLNPQHSSYRINPQHSPYQVNASHSPGKPLSIELSTRIIPQHECSRRLPQL